MSKKRKSSKSLKRTQSIKVDKEKTDKKEKVPICWEPMHTLTLMTQIAQPLFRGRYKCVSCHCTKNCKEQLWACKNCQQGGHAADPFNSCKICYNVRVCTVNRHNLKTEEEESFVCIVCNETIQNEKATSCDVESCKSKWKWCQKCRQQKCCVNKKKHPDELPMMDFVTNDPSTKRHYTCNFCKIKNSRLNGYWKCLKCRRYKCANCYGKQEQLQLKKAEQQKSKRRNKRLFASSSTSQKKKQKQQPQLKKATVKPIKEKEKIKQKAPKKVKKFPKLSKGKGKKDLFKRLSQLVRNKSSSNLSRSNTLLRDLKKVAQDIREKTEEEIRNKFENQQSQYEKANDIFFECYDSYIFFKYLVIHLIYYFFLGPFFHLFSCCSKQAYFISKNMRVFSTKQLAQWISGIMIVYYFAEMDAQYKVICYGAIIFIATIYATLDPNQIHKIQHHFLENQDLTDQNLKQKFKLHISEFILSVQQHDLDLIILWIRYKQEQDYKIQTRIYNKIKEKEEAEYNTEDKSQLMYPMKIKVMKAADDDDEEETNKEDELSDNTTDDEIFWPLKVHTKSKGRQKSYLNRISSDRDKTRVKQLIHKHYLYECKATNDDMECSYVNCPNSNYEDEEGEDEEESKKVYICKECDFQACSKCCKRFTFLKQYEKTFLQTIIMSNPQVNIQCEDFQDFLRFLKDATKNIKQYQRKKYQHITTIAKYLILHYEEKIWWADMIVYILTLYRAQDIVTFVISNYQDIQDFPIQFAVGLIISLLLVITLYFMFTLLRFFFLIFIFLCGKNIDLSLKGASSLFKIYFRTKFFFFYICSFKLTTQNLQFIISCFVINGLITVFLSMANLLSTSSFYQIINFCFLYFLYQRIFPFSNLLLISLFLNFSIFQIIPNKTSFFLDFIQFQRCVFRNRTSRGMPLKIFGEEDNLLFYLIFIFGLTDDYKDFGSLGFFLSLSFSMTTKKSNVNLFEPEPTSTPWVWFFCKDFYDYLFIGNFVPDNPTFILFFPSYGLLKGFRSQMEILLAWACSGDIVSRNLFLQSDLTWYLQNSLSMPSIKSYSASDFFDLLLNGLSLEAKTFFEPSFSIKFRF